MFYIFQDIEEFNIWHEQVKIEIGLPFADGITTEYTSPIIQDDGSVIAFSDEEFAEGLTVTSYSPPVNNYEPVDETLPE
jgi:hypothetical protein